MAKYSPAQKKAVLKYKAANYKRIPFDVPAEFADTVRLEASARGMSVNGFIKFCIQQQIAADVPPVAERQNTLSLGAENGIEGRDR